MVWNPGKQSHPEFQEEWSRKQKPSGLVRRGREELEKAAEITSATLSQSA
jgi:hypothetical protein